MRKIIIKYNPLEVFGLTGDPIEVSEVLEISETPENYQKLIDSPWDWEFQDSPKEESIDLPEMDPKDLSQVLRFIYSIYDKSVDTITKEFKFSFTKDSLEEAWKKVKELEENWTQPILSYELVKDMIKTLDNGDNLMKRLSEASKKYHGYKFFNFNEFLHKLYKRGES